MTGFGGPVGGVGRRESQAALVGHEQRVAGLVAFEVGVVEVGEVGGGQGVRVQSHVGGQGGSELAEQVASGVSAEAEQFVVGAGEEAQRVDAGVT